MKNWRNWVTWGGVISIIIIFGLTGCAKRPTPPLPDTPDAVVTPPVAGQAFCTASGQRILDPDGKPLFFIVDTAWLATERLTLAEFDQYAQVRKGQGFNTVMIGANGSWWAKAGQARPEMWNKLGQYLDILAAKGMYCVIAPQFVEYDNAGKGFCRFTPAECESMAVAVGTLFSTRRNLLFWMVSGLDEPAGGVSTTRRIGAGIRAGDPNHLIAYHPRAKHTSIEAVPAGPENQVPLYQSYSEKDGKVIAGQLKTLDATGLPYANVEPCYEGDGNTPADVAAVAGVCAGFRVSGMAYGNHAVWGFTPGKWKQALSAPGVGKFIQATKKAGYNQ